jgi:hypothetical protein
MDLYNDFDLNTFKKNIDGVVKKLSELVADNYVPTNKERRKVQEIILKFAKENKRKMYGGYGLHLAIKNKHASGSFYKDDELFSKDLDLYSPSPIKDIVELSNILYKEGFQNVYAREAIHKETYTLTVNSVAYCDFSYVPRNVYNKIPFISIDGYIVTYPYFLEIDYLKMFIDPILSHYRWEKSFERFYLLQKYYPIKTSKKKIDWVEKMPQKIYDTMINFMENNKSIITTGFYAYNMYIKESNTKSDYIKQIPVPYFEFISTDYENDAKKVVNELQKIDHDKVQIEEHYPFFTFTNFSTYILFDGKLVAIIYTNLHNVCMSFIQYNKIALCVFHFNLRMCLINAMMSRANDNREREQMFHDMASHLIQMRRNYFDGTEKTFFDNTIFQDFVINCAGIAINDKINKAMEFKQSKNKSVFKYDPEHGDKINVEEWKFANSSGNAIRNAKNFKIKFDDEKEDMHVKEQQKNNEEDEKGNDTVS